MTQQINIDSELSQPLVIGTIRNLRLHHVLYVVIGYVVLQAICSILFHPLRSVPGPFTAKFTELWRTRKYFQGNWHDDILDLHRKYGPVVRIAPNEVAFVDKEALIKVYGHSTGTKKTMWYHVWDMPRAAKGFFASTDLKEHAFLRKRVSNAYTMSTILTLEPQIQSIANVVWEKFHKIAQSGATIDMQTWTGYFAFDIVTKLGLGSPIGFVDQSKDVHGIMKSIQGFFYWHASMGYIPGQMAWFYNPVSNFLLKYLGPESTQGQNNFFTWLFKIVTTRMAEEDAGNPKDRTRDMLDIFISMKDPDGSPAQLSGVLIEGGNLIGAGADTTSVGISVVFRELLQHQEDYARIQREVDETYTKNNIMEVGGLTYLMAEKIPYLNACIKEATRLTPSILWQLPREAPADGITIAGHYIPPGMTLGMSPISQNRCKEIFGEDADEWRPSRWLVSENGSSPERIREMEKYNVTFGFGSRTCVGRNLALVELHKFVGQFARQFDAEFVNKASPFKQRSQWFCLQEDMAVRLKERSHLS